MAFEIKVPKIRSVNLHLVKMKIKYLMTIFHMWLQNIKI